MSASLHVHIRAIRYEARGILSYELRPPPEQGGAELPPFTAGAHVDVHLRDGMVRSYSLLNDDAERGRYVIAVNKDPAGRGGSRYMHEALKVGDSLAISAPRNHFELDEGARHSVMIAGGIGITPLWSMVQKLERLGRSWELHYSARTRQHAALLDRLEQLPPAARRRVHVNFDHEPGARMLDLAAIVSAAAPDAHFYCCGPAGMLRAFEDATASRDAGFVHLEHFGADAAPASARGGFTVHLARSGRDVPVPEGSSILDALLGAGVDVGHSCLEGVCGSCEVAVLDGVPEHRDLVLTRAEKASNRSIMVCCSGCQGERLVLDL
ncbi:PDR/VanB family oxidoreductase [Pigmentiphaga kullae]|uniref:Vanillate O-demethylase ferredoxin subunit n=1 Tax=Pigmentiphaga kullae TaxID=151784 RepID=A0A4Q7N6T8_9BURK|nr:PDR/VanB family oxidoreductase [Pigmentiphaga kullae]RZS76975.1 vanillate O-demethylase ferredoxin subunit [Pigmentiphaga kullae]